MFLKTKKQLRAPCDAFKKLDLYGIPVHLRFKNESTFKTLPGAIITIIAIVIILIYLVEIVTVAVQMPYLGISTIE